MQSSLRYSRDSYSDRWMNTAKVQNSAAAKHLSRQKYLSHSRSISFVNFSHGGILTISCGLPFSPKTDLNRGLMPASFFFRRPSYNERIFCILTVSLLFLSLLSFHFSSYKNHTVWRACLVGSGQAPASTLLRSPGWCPVVLARSTPFLFSTVVRAKTFSINASFFLLLSAGRRVRAKAILKTPARCNKANCFSHA